MAEGRFFMSENLIDDYRTSGKTEDEFGIALKLYLGIRFAVYAIGVFMILGALLYTALGINSFDDLVSNATGLSATQVDSNFDGYKICMFVQAFYTVGAAVCVALTYIRRSQLFAIIDLGLFVVLAAVMFIMGGGGLLFNGSAWIVYFILNPIFSFIALFAGNHFNYMNKI